MLRAGFELSARVAEGAAAGTQAGALHAGDGTAVVHDSATHVAYLVHTLAGTSAAAGERRWTVRWTAPADVRGAVAIHVAANAANDDDSPFGDYIYASAARVLAGTAR